MTGMSAGDWVNSLLFGNQNKESQQTYQLSKINSANYNKDFVTNLIALNQGTDYMAAYMRVAQQGIDQANENIIQKIQDFISDLIIIFTGGSGTNFDWGDLLYFIQALGAMFGFNIDVSGPIDLVGAAEHAIENFFQGGIQTLIANALLELGNLLSSVPIVGTTLEEIIDGVASLLNTTATTATTANTNASTALTGAAAATSTANTAITTASTAHDTAVAAQSTATSAASTASSAASTASTAASTASTAATTATAAQGTANNAQALAEYWTAEALVASAEVLLGYNELLIGMVMDVPSGRTRTVTRLHFAFVSLPGSITISTRLDGTEIQSTTIPANQLKTTVTGLTTNVTDKQRLSWYVTAVTNVTTVMSCAATGTIV